MIIRDNVNEGSRIVEARDSKCSDYYHEKIRDNRDPREVLPTGEE